MQITEEQENESERKKEVEEAVCRETGMREMQGATKKVDERQEKMK